MDFYLSVWLQERERENDHVSMRWVSGKSYNNQSNRVIFANRALLFTIAKAISV